VLTICESSLQAIVGATTESVGIAPARKISPRQLIGVGEVIAKFSYPELDSIQHSRDDWLADRLLLDDGICKSEPSPGGPTFSDGPIYRRAAFRKLVHPEIGPNEIIGAFRNSIQDVTDRAEQIRASGGTVTGRA
jgi:hypothetical protein